MKNILFLAISLPFLHSCGQTEGKPSRTASLITKPQKSQLASPTYSTWTDPGDGQTYKTVRIGDREWLAQNYNRNVNDSFSACINGNCAKYGLKYSYNGVIDINQMLTDGWRIPGYDDVKALFNLQGMQTRNMEVGDGYPYLDKSEASKPGVRTPDRLFNTTGFSALMDDKRFEMWTDMMYQSTSGMKMNYYFWIGGSKESPRLYYNKYSVLKALEDNSIRYAIRLVRNKK